MDLKLADKVVVVTGASKGIGYACAEAFAREGARVVLVSRGQRESRCRAGTTSGDAPRGDRDRRRPRPCRRRGDDGRRSRARRRADRHSRELRRRRPAIRAGRPRRRRVACGDGRQVLQLHSSARCDAEANGGAGSWRHRQHHRQWRTRREPGAPAGRRCQRRADARNRRPCRGVRAERHPDQCDQPRHYADRPRARGSRSRVEDDGVARNPSF